VLAAVEAALLVTVPTTLLPVPLPVPTVPPPPVTSVTLATPDVSGVDVVPAVTPGTVAGVAALVSTEPVAVEPVVPPTPVGQAAAPSAVPEFVE